MVAHNASTAKCPRAWNIARTAASTRRLDWTHETSQSRILRRAAVDDMQDTPPVLAPLQSVLLSVQAHHQRRRNDRFCRCQRVEFDAYSEGSEPHLADPRPMELARAGRPADRPWKRQNEFVQVLTLFKLHAEVVLGAGSSPHQAVALPMWNVQRLLSRHPRVLGGQWRERHRGGSLMQS